MIPGHRHPHPRKAFECGWWLGNRWLSKTSENHEIRSKGPGLTRSLDACLVADR